MVWGGVVVDKLLESKAKRREEKRRKALKELLIFVPCYTKLYLTAAGLENMLV